MMILTAVVFGLVLTAFSNASAQDITKNISDAKDDVYDENTMNFTASKPNIDVRQIIANQEGSSITIDLRVENEIENRGDLTLFRVLFGDIDQGDNFDEIINSTEYDTVGYTCILETDEHSYMIFYANDEISISELSENTAIDIEFEIKSLQKERDTVSFFFNLLNESETMQKISGFTAEMSGGITDFNIYFDEVDLIPLMVETSVLGAGVVGEAIDFTPIVTGGQPEYTYLWEFGDGETSSEEAPVHIYDEPGVYEYTLTVTDQENAQDTASGNIEILESEADGTPGFEFIIALAAIGCIFLWKRKRYP